MSRFWKNRLGLITGIVIMAGTLTALQFSGCEKHVQTDPTTGQAQTKYYLDPNTAASIDKAGEAAVGTASALSYFFPVAGSSIAAALATALGIYRKLKPELVREKQKGELYHLTAHQIVTGLEAFKVGHPTEWFAIKDCLHISPEAENIIRGIRGLPYIEKEG